MRKQPVIFLGVLVLHLLLAPLCFGATYNLDDFSQEWSWSRLHTDQLQTAIDTCSINGGGTVVVPSGFWITGTVFFKDNVTLELEKGARIIAAPIPSLFPRIQTRAEAGSNKISNHALLYAEGVRNIAIRGKGTIYNIGLIDPILYERHERPHIIKFVDCTNVEVSGVSLEGTANWTQLYLLCDTIRISDITVYAVFGSASDGLDIDSCSNVLVENSTIDSYNDSIAIKSTTSTPSENILVRNCTLRSGKRGIKVGTESIGGFRNIEFKDCIVERGRRTIYNPMPKEMRAGIFMTTVDGGDATGITLDSIRVDGAQTPLFIVASRRLIHVEVGTMKQITLRNLTTTTLAPMPSIIASDPPGKIRELTIDHVFAEQPEHPIRFATEETLLASQPGKPSYKMFGKTFEPAQLFISGVSESQFSVAP